MTTAIARLRRDHEGCLEAAAARLSWPFSAEHELWFHRRRCGARLRALLERTGSSAGARPEALAARGRLKRLLGDDAGAAADLTAALAARPELAIARAWLAELDLTAASAEKLLDQALESREPPSEALVYRSVFRLRRADPRAAAVDAAAARRARPRDALAALLHGTALERLGRRPAALAAYAAAGRLEPNCSVPFLLAARAQTSPRLRAAALEKALRADPSYALITLSWFKPGSSWDEHVRRLVSFAFAKPELAGWYQRQQEIHYAPFHFQEYADSKRLLAARPRASWAAALVARGILRCPPDPARAAEGLRLAELAVRRAPGAGWPRAWRALGLLKAGRRREALADFDACLARQPFYHRALAWRGALRRQLGLVKEALSDLDAACAIDELYPFSAHERSLARRLSGDWVGAALELDRAFRLDFRYSWVFSSSREPSAAEFTRAEAELARACAGHPSCASLLAWRGDAHRRAGDLSAALRHLRRAAALDPGHANARAFLGRALLDSGRAAEAAARLREAAALAPGLTIFAGWLAEADWRRGRRAQALAALEGLLRRVPPVQVWWVLQLRAQLLLEAGRPRRALADLRAARRCEGRHADAYYLSARARLDLGDARGAETEVEKALAISPNLGRAYLLRAQARARRGRSAGALADYRTVLERFPGLFNDQERASVTAILEGAR